MYHYLHVAWTVYPDAALETPGGIASVEVFALYFLLHSVLILATVIYQRQVESSDFALHYIYRQKNIDLSRPLPNHEGY